MPSWAGWTETEKPWDRARPMHRINSPSFDLGKDSPSGHGFDCGCHTRSQGPNDTVIASCVFDRLMVALPGWVPVLELDPATKQLEPRGTEHVHEAEGLLVRSFHTWTDVPQWQWHRWYDWNFHIDPADGYKHLRGLGNTVADVKSPKQPVIRGFGGDTSFKGALECELDAGAISSGIPGTNNPGGMYFKDWAWPLAGQMFWAKGLWIYDCGHASPDNINGLHRTEIHPCRAIATARWQAVQFPENDNLFVPGIQFMFFASRFGGYRETTTLKEADYQFIVDLPEIDPAGPHEWAIGHTFQFPRNTGVLRAPQLLWKADFDAFSNARGRQGKTDPIVELKESPANPRQRQVKVTIPLQSSGEISSNHDFYGVILSMGWRDPDRSQARKVRHVTVRLNSIVAGSDPHDFAFTTGQWRVKIGVNGQWSFVNADVDPGTKIDLSNRPPIRFSISEDDDIAINVHGWEQDGVGDLFERSEPDRTINFDGDLLAFAQQNPSTYTGVTWGVSAGQLVDYQRHILNGGPTAQARMGIARILCYHIGNQSISSAGNQNDPIGMIDPSMNPAEPHNPLKPNFEGVRGFQCKAFFTEEIGDTAELAEDPREDDYFLNYSVEVHRQQVP
jgi:hypothetical protein